MNRLLLIALLAITHLTPADHRSPVPDRLTSGGLILGGAGLTGVVIAALFLSNAKNAREVAKKLGDTLREQQLTREITHLSYLFYAALTALGIGSVSAGAGYYLKKPRVSRPTSPPLPTTPPKPTTPPVALSPAAAAASSAPATIPFAHPWLAQALGMNPSTKSGEELRATTITNFAQLQELVDDICGDDPTEELAALGVISTPERPGLYGHYHPEDSYNCIQYGQGRKEIWGRFSSEHMHLIVYLAALGLPVETLSDWCSKAIEDEDECLDDMFRESHSEIEALKGAYYFLRKFFRLHAERKDEELHTLLHKIFGSLYKPRTEDAS